MFFNLQSLPEIVLLAIDATIRTTIDLSRDTLDLNALVLVHSDLVSTTVGGVVNGVTNRSAVQAALVSASSISSLALSQSQQKKSANSLHNATISQQNLPNSYQVRTALKEMAREWGSIVSDQAMQIHVLQRVMAKKEDPSTHVKFTDVLESAQQFNPSLGANRLLDLFWDRLQSSLQDIAAEKLKSQPVAACRLYPFLRKVAVDSVQNLEVWVCLHSFVYLFVFFLLVCIDHSFTTFDGSFLIFYLLID